MAQATLDMTTSVAVQPELAFQRKSRTATMEAVEDIIYGSVSCTQRLGNVEMRRRS